MEIRKTNLAMKSNILIFIFSIFLALSCQYQNRESIILNKASNTTTALCDTTKTMRYSMDILPILKSNCYSCHSNTNNGSLGGSIAIENFTDLKNLVDANYIIHVIKQDDPANYKSMPKNSSKLPDCDVAKIQKWITSGALNN